VKIDGLNDLCRVCAGLTLEQCWPVCWPQPHLSSAVEHQDGNRERDLDRL